MNDLMSLWNQQCDAARRIREDFGTEKALGYLLGEKLMNVLRTGDTDPEVAATLPTFAAGAREVFRDQELRGYFSGPRRIGALGHVLDEAGHELFRAAGAVREDVEDSAQDAIRFERMKRLLLPE